MILGSYPCCGGNLCLLLSDGQLPRMQKEQCPHCEAVVWHRHSRLEPKSYTEAAFLAEFDVDEQTRLIRPKPQQKEQQ